MERIDRSLSKKVFWFLWGLCIVGSWSILPYIHYLGIVPASVSTLSLFLLGTTQAGLFFGLVCWLSSKILPKTDLEPFRFERPLKSIVYPGVIAGIVVSLVIFLFEKTLFHSSVFSGVLPSPFWAGALASIYGAVNEEVLLRLFLFTLFYLILTKAFKMGAHQKLLWVANIVVALVFGLAHLPAAFQVASPSVFEVVRILFLNGIAGLVFGWLYWSRGLWAAMCAHFTADLMIHVFLA